jgi:hypothetical protein
MTEDNEVFCVIKVLFVCHGSLLTQKQNPYFMGF